LAGDDAGHDDQAEPFSDAVFVTFCSPSLHQKNRARRHRDDAQEDGEPLHSRINQLMLARVIIWMYMIAE
jgi:hypothetical protein